MTLLSVLGSSAPEEFLVGLVQSRADTFGTLQKEGSGEHSDGVRRRDHSHSSDTGLPPEGQEPLGVGVRCWRPGTAMVAVVDLVPVGVVPVDFTEGPGARLAFFHSRTSSVQ